MKTSLGPDDRDDGDPIRELMAIAEAKQDLAARETLAVRRARHRGLSWKEIGFLLGVSKQTAHRKYRKVT